MKFSVDSNTLRTNQSTTSSSRFLRRQKLLSKDGTTMMNTLKALTPTGRPTAPQWCGTSSSREPFSPFVGSLRLPRKTNRQWPGWSVKG